jgi:hypothetical protein
MPSNRSSGIGLAEQLRRGRAFVGADILQVHARIFLLERLLQRPDRLIDDQRGVPDHLPLLLCRLDQRRVGGVGSGRRNCADDREQTGRNQAIDGHHNLLAEWRETQARPRL